MKSDSFRNNRKALAPLLFCTLFIAGQPLTVRATGNEQSVQTVQQQIKVSGTVSDAMGPVIGVSVVEKGNTSNGTITDVNGNFSLSVPSGATLLISYIGYKAQEVQAVAGRVIDVTLKENTEMLDEVVVVGFGTQKKVNLTGSVGIATAKELESRPVTSAVQALQGLVPGLKISTNTGELDKNMGISIRGTGTIGKDANGKSYSSGSPLILIDGMEGDLNTVNPQDIENISVLKDAAASSIYGSRAPFGVILVTTKSGKIGKTSVNYNANLRISSPINMPKSMDSYSFAVMMNAGLVNSNGKAKFSNETLQNMLDYQAGKLTGGLVPSTAAGSTSWMDTWSTGYANTDLLDVLYKDRVTSQEHNLSINGGSEKMTYYVSLNYLGQNGLLNIGDDGLKRYNTAAKISSTLTKWLKFNYSMRFTRTDNWKPTDFDDNVYSDLTRNWPNQPVKDPNGYWWHPNLVRFVNGGERKTQTDRIYQQAAFVFEQSRIGLQKQNSITVL